MLFFEFPEDASWNDKRDCVEFSVILGPYEGTVRVPCRVFQGLLDQRPTPEESCRMRERDEILASAINRLGPKVRRAILLRDIEERSAEETARILGTTISAVKARVFQGRRKLRAAVNSGLLRDYSVDWAETQHC